MMKKANKFLSILLALALCLSLLPTAAFAAEGDEEDVNPTESTDPTENPGDGEEEHGTTTVTIDTTESGTTITVGSTEPTDDTEITVENTVNDPVTNEDGSVTTTWTGDNVDDETEEPTGPVVTVIGEETVTTTEDAVNDAGQTGTLTETTGEETITVTMPEQPAGAPEVEEIDPQEDIEWTTGPGTDPEGWKDDKTNPSTPVGDPTTTDATLSPVETPVELTQQGDGSLSGSGTVAALDRDAFVAGLEKQYTDADIDADISVSEDGNTVTVTEVINDPESGLQIPNVFPDGLFGASGPVTPVEGDFTPPEGFELVVDEAGEPVVDEKGRITYRKTEEGPEEGGFKTTTTTSIFVSKSEATGTVTATETRKVRTTTYDLTNADLKLWGAVGQFGSYGEWTEKPAEEQPDPLEKQTVEELMAQSGVEGLTKEEAQAVIDAVLNQDPEDPVTLEGAAKAFYDFLTLDGRPVGTEPAKPVISEATVTVTPNSGIEDSGLSYTAEVNFTVQMTPSVTGDLLVKIAGEEGREFIRIQTDGNVPDDESYKVEDLGNGFYKVTIYHVRLSSATEPVDLEIIANEETLTRSLAVDGTITIPGSGDEEPPPDQNLTNEETVDRKTGKDPETGKNYNLEYGNPNYGTYTDIHGEQYPVDYSQHPPGGEGGGGDSRGIAVDMIPQTEGGKTEYLSAVISNPTDMDIPVKYIAVKASNGYVVYEVEGGVLYAGQSITVESVSKEPGDSTSGIHGISHLCLLGIGEPTEPKPGVTTEPTYMLTETLQTRSASATLSLNLTGGVIQESSSEKGQVRGGVATVTKTQVTTQEQIVTVRSWDGTDFQPNEGDPTPPPPGPTPPPPGPTPPPPGPTPPPPGPTPPPPGGGGGGGGTGGGTGGGGGGGTTPTTTIPDAPTPLTETPVAAPVTQIAEEIVPLAEIVEEEVPLAEAPEEEYEEILDEEIPLADVPETGDGSGIWYAMALTGLCGLAALSLKKREEEEA